MPDKLAWTIAVTSLSTTEIVKLLRQLNESEYKEVILDLRRELVKRARVKEPAMKQ